MITDITVRNFKSIKDISHMKLTPLTILTGVNSSGKSNIMEAISFFGQASRLGAPESGQSIDFRTVFRSGDIRYPAPIENFVTYKKNAESVLHFEIQVMASENEVKGIEDLLKKYAAELSYFSLDGQGAKIQTLGYSYTFTVAANSFSQELFINNKKFVQVSQEPFGPTRMVYPKEWGAMSNSAGVILNENVFRLAGSPPQSLPPITAVAVEIVRYIREKSKRIYLISGERGRIDAQKGVRERSDPPPTWIGYKSEYLIEILSDCSTRKPEKFRMIQEWARRFRLSDITGGWTVDNTLESNFRDDLSGVNLNTYLAGFGSRQILSIITQIFYSEPGDVIMIEEPEISLHPENQVLLYELFSEAVSQGKQIICSTHSPFFILALSRIVKKKLLSVDEISVYHITRGQEGTESHLLKLDKNGFIIGGVPSFMQVELELFKDWSESLEEEETTEEK
jgi:AAA15 family ATPase/GTPase